MSWTREKPTSTGWYWYRGEYTASELQPVVIYVEVSGSSAAHKYPCAWQPFMDYADPLEDFPGEWCGPIAPPDIAEGGLPNGNAAPGAGSTGS